MVTSSWLYTNSFMWGGTHIFLLEEHYNNVLCTVQRRRVCALERMKSSHFLYFLTTSTPLLLTSNRKIISMFFLQNVEGSVFCISPIFSLLKIQSIFLVCQDTAVVTVEMWIIWIWFIIDDGSSMIRNLTLSWCSSKARPPFRSFSAFLLNSNMVKACIRKKIIGYPPFLWEKYEGKSTLIRCKQGKVIEQVEIFFVSFVFPLLDYADAVLFYPIYL